MNKPVIVVEQIDLNKWRQFQQYYEPFKAIVDAGVFDVRSGIVSLHFDHLGILQVIRRDDQLYNRKYNTLSTP